MQIKDFTSEVENKGILCVNDEPMCKHTTFHIGGNADVFITASSAEQVKTIISAADKYNVPLFCIGRGSNLLVSDKGIEGAVISLAGINDISVKGNRITAGAGVPLSALCIAAREASLSGIEFAFGIPGSVGGALFMNAGAYGGEMSNVVVSAECVDKTGNIRTLSHDEMALGYRTSIFKDEELLIISVTVELEKAEKADIAALMEKYASSRKEKQPLESPSAGSTFKRPQGHFAGALIESSNLKGTCCGGAQVSTKHAGFVINKGNATCADVRELIKKIQDTVLEHDGVKLETEVIFVGRE